MHMSCTAHYRDWGEGLTDMGRRRPITGIAWNKAADRNLVNIINPFQSTSIECFLRSQTVRKDGKPAREHFDYHQTSKTPS